MANIYRKTALDKLSSPEQLDKAITVISPSFWIAIIGLGAILLIALLWSIFGRIPISVSADGIYMNPGGIRSVVAEASGLVDEVYVANGDVVKAGQELAHIDASGVEEELAALQKRRSSVEKVTFDSTGDVGSADNKALLDIKAQKVVSDATLTTNQSALKSREEELEEQKKATDAAKQEYELAREAYLNSMGASDTSAQQLAYQDAQSALSSSQSYYESAKNSLSQAEVQAGSLATQKSEVEATIDQLNATNQQAQAAMETANADMASAQAAQQSAQAQMASAQTDEERQAAEAAYNQATADFQAAQAAYQEASNTAAVAQNQLSSAQSQLSNLQLQIDTNAAQVDSAATSVD